MKRKSSILLGILAAALFSSCQPKFDCVDDYCGWIVVDTAENKTIISDGCKEFKEVNFPALYGYTLGDTVCKTPHLTLVRLKVLKEKAEIDAIIEAHGYANE